MSIEALFGAFESGLIYALVALGVLISFRILDFPDLTADGSFPLGGAVAAVCIVNGINPWLACAAGMAAGACAGVVTAWLHVSLKILQLLASILVMVALYSVNLRIMGAPNVPLIGEQTVFTPFVAADFSNQFWVQPLIILGFVIAAKLLLDWFFSMLSAQHLEITFNPGTPIETRALRGMSLDIPAGQFVTVIGSNGAGKSTFLNAISGDQTVDSGRIAIDGVDVTRMPVWARAERVARVFQDPMAGTCEDLTIEENMALAQRRGTFRNLGRAVKASMREGFREKLATLGLGLENRLTDRIGLLSGGQRQAVSLLMAALQPSRILLLDEHTAALDPRTADFVLRLTERIVAENKAHHHDGHAQHAPGAGRGRAAR
jgi:putative ABC transport system ATP-binding protein